MSCVDANRGRHLVVQSLAVLVGLLTVLIAAIARVEAVAIERWWHLDPEGFVDSEYGLPRSSPFESLHFGELCRYLLNPIFLAALVSLGALLWGLHRLDRVHAREEGRRLGLIWMAAPLAAVIALGLAVAQLTYRWDQDTLAQIHNRVSSIELHYFMSCFGDMNPCSLMHTFDVVWALAARLIVLVALLLSIPAIRCAWRAGASGHKLGPKASAMTLACFVAGAVALIGTSAHRHDRATKLATCDLDEHHDFERRPTLDQTPAELQGVELDACDVEFQEWIESEDRMRRPWNDFGHALWPSGALTRLADSEHEAFTPSQLIDELERNQSFISDEVDRFGGGEERTLELYIDARMPMPVLAKVLGELRDLGVHNIVLIVRTVRHGELHTLGPWRRAELCKVGYLRFEDGGLALGEHGDVATLIERARAAERMGLTVGGDELCLGHDPDRDKIKLHVSAGICGLTRRHSDGPTE